MSTEITEPLHIKYRPKSFDEVIGQKGAVTKLRKQIKDAQQHSYLFGGPSGTGKTTLARICASQLGCEGLNLWAINAADKTGIDEMRGVMRKAHMRPLQGDRVSIIVDECHRLSGNAWDSMLTMVEEPPAHLYWFFCTTEPAKVPKAILTRCTVSVLEPVSTDDIFDLLDRVCREEKFDTTDEVLDYVAREAKGSPRQALVYLAECANASDAAEASARIQRVAPADKDLIEILRAMVSGQSVKWERVVEYVKANKDRDAESIRLQIVNYLGAVLLNTKGAPRAASLCQMIECFSTPCNRSEGPAPLLLAFGELVLGE